MTSLTQPYSSSPSLRASAGAGDPEVRDLSAAAVLEKVRLDGPAVQVAVAAGEGYVYPIPHGRGGRRVLIAISDIGFLAAESLRAARALMHACRKANGISGEHGPLCGPRRARAIEE